ncbi:asparagine synthase-related protein [Streptomyces hygroscopicus]|uniref:asparagine synthase-related protein n=1 Tax=Streptomyces hygroscopicus TaxID=1912 RepID=UPI0004CC6069|nr:asparagine synthase-related protein [Streptomyces hygroscopicus]
MSPGSALVFRDHAVPDVVRLPAGPRATLGEGAWRLRDVLTTVVTRRALAAERVTTDLSGGVGSGSVTCLAVARKPVLAVTYTDARMAGDDHRPPAMGRPDSCAVPGHRGRRRLPGDPALRAGPAGVYKPLARTAMAHLVPDWLLTRQTKTLFTTSVFDGLAANAPGSGSTTMDWDSPSTTSSIWGMTTSFRWPSGSISTRQLVR